jgi:RNA polymerase sigma factor (sigma-70 family)
VRRERYADACLPSISPANPETHLLETQEAEEVQAVLMELSPADRLLIVMKFIEGFSHEEIAGVLHSSVASSRARLLRAKKLFQERFLRRRGL